MASNIPAEIWLQIFHYAVDDEHLFGQVLPTSVAESSWFKVVYGGWSLRSPQDHENLLQRKSYAMKKAIVSTCKAWRSLGTEFLFRFLFFDDPVYLPQLCSILDDDPSLGWWTKRIHITRYYSGMGSTMEKTHNALVSIIRHCPNLEILVMTWPISTSLTAVANALCTYCPQTLRTLHLSVAPSALAKTILMLDSLPGLISLHLEFEGISPENIRLGSTSDLSLHFPRLEQLILRGPFQEFVEQATGWNMPALRSFSLDFLSYHNDLPDIIEFLTHHGTELTYLDINCIPRLDVPTILDLCPLLITFAFNLDWEVSIPGRLVPTLVNRPHENITTIGCHQLLYAFGVGDNAKYARADPTKTAIIRDWNDRNFAALNKEDFPNLRRVRVLNRTLLRDLEAADGPSEDCFERWERWWDQCAGQGIRLEDCTGAPLGTLPLDEDDLSESESEDEHEDGGDKGVEKRGDYLVEIRNLLEECRLMRESADEPLFPFDEQFQFGGPPQFDGPLQFGGPFQIGGSVQHGSPSQYGGPIQSGSSVQSRGPLQYGSSVQYGGRAQSE